MHFYSLVNKHEKLVIDNNQIDLFLSPRFLLFSATICIDCVRLCNREYPVNPLSIRLVSEQGGPVPASNGISLQTVAISKQDSAGTVMMLTSYEPELACTPTVIDWIRQQYLQGVRMVCIETAAYVFAQANLFELNPANEINKPAWQLAAHYEAAPAYHELFGEHISLERLYSYSEPVYSSAGAMSTMDLMLYLIDELRSESLANRIAYVFNHQRIPKSQRKPSRAEGAISKLDTRLGRIVSLMQASIGYPESLEKIYQQAGVEASTARRLFNRVLKQSPKQYYRHLRVEYGKEMLLNSELSVAQVAQSCGYSDASSFTRAYNQVFGITPGKDKQLNLARLK